MAPRRSSVFFHSWPAALLSLLASLATPAAAQHVLRNDATGGDCGAQSIGSWSPGTLTCKLTVNVVGTIELASDGLTLDGDNNEVTARPGDVNGVTANGRTGVVITHLVVDGFDFGILLLGGSGNRVVGNTVWGGSARPAGASCGIRIENSNGNRIAENKAILRPAGEGICLVNARQNTVEHNLVAANDRGNIRLTDSDLNTVRRNHTFPGSDRGIDGIQLQRSSGNVLAWNVGEGYGGAGMALVKSHRNTIIYNRHSANDGAAILLTDSDHNQILCNDSSDDARAAHIGPGSVGNTFWLNNSFGRQTALDTAVPAANAFQIPPPTGGNYWQAHPACVDANGDRFCDLPLVFPGNQDALPPHVRPIAWLIEPMFCESVGEPQQQQQPVKPDSPGAAAGRP